MRLICEQLWREAGPSQDDRGELNECSFWSSLVLEDEPVDRWGISRVAERLRGLI